MRTIVRCALLAPALAFGLPAVRAEEPPDQKTAPAASPPNDPNPARAQVSVPSAKPIPPFLAKAKPPLPAVVAQPAAGGRGDDLTKKPSTNPEFSSSIQRSFPYAPSPESAADTTQADDALPVVDMKPFHVATSRIVDRAAKGMEERRQQEREKAFNAKDGGRFGKIGPAEIGLKYNLQHKGWDILSIPW